MTPAEDHVRDDAVHVLGGHGEPITAVGFVLGGKLLVTGDAEGNVAAWRTPGFERHFELAQTPPAPVHCIAGGSRGDVYFGRGVAVKQWQTGAGFLTDFSQLQSFTLGEAHTREVVPVLSTAREVISGGYDGALCFWDPDSGDVRTGNLGSPILSLACTAGALHDRESGGLLAAGHEDGTVSILDLDACEPIGRYEAHARDVYALSFQNVVFNRQILLATVSPADAVVRLWKSSELVTEIAAPGFAVAFSPDGRFLAHGDGKEVVVRDGRDWQVVHRLRGHQHLISWLAFSPSARMEDLWDGWLASASHDGTVRIWSL